MSFFNKGLHFRYKKMFVVLLLALAGATTFAQQRTVTGTVKNAKTKQPLALISVQVEASPRGTMTSNNGTFSLQVNTGETVTFSGVGYSAKQVIMDDKNVLDVELEQGEGELESVVVTALGIKKEDKALGYAVTKLDSTQLTDAVAGNWTDVLSGKVAGLNMIRSGSGPTGSNKIILRGENNLTGENEALIVVDGVVINNSSGRRTANGSENIYGTGSDNMPADYGSGLNDINPEDIESVTVLKGPGAAALYGQRGANGAIIITTKASKRKTKGVSIIFNSNYSQERVNRWPDMQWEYGMGLDGQTNYEYGVSANSSSSSAYGPRFEGQLFHQYNPVTQDRDSVATPWRPYTNKIREYFETGHTYNNSISLDARMNKTTMRFAYTNVQNTWIMPNTGYRRNTGALTINSKLTDKLTVSAKLNYTNKYSDNLPGAGYGNQSIMYWFIFWQPNADLDWLRNYWQNGQVGRKIEYPYSSFLKTLTLLLTNF
ncbi:TonB-dependent receptor plug domain-containing protein [Niabella sp. W65]|nr:TonB-dependent receptor plug domain-containing protein [Niabella sp. W65]MCH7369477.1 TonB-dependent receptor plug domain-containing protein [Niabella sp. W65]ULT45011.1 TonB-dependent receptor plug domain-containing protein [Niabella sp. I65]